MRGGKRAIAAGIIALGMMSSSSVTLAAEFELHPSIALSEEYNDNIEDTADDRKTDFVTRVQPAVRLLYLTPRVKADADYSFEYRNYARGGRGDEQVHTLALNGSAALVGNFLFLDAGDTVRRVSLDVTRDVTAESLFVNQTDENRATVSPYLLWRLEKGVLKTGYRYLDVRYWGVGGGESGVDRTEHRGYAEAQYQPARRLSLNAVYSYGNVDTELVGYSQHDLSGGTRYEYAEKSFIYGGIGNSWQDFGDGRSASNLFWHAGVTHDFGYLLATLETVVQYSEDPLTVSTKETRYSATVERRLEKGTAGISVSHAEFDSEYEETESGGSDRRRDALNVFARYELSERLAMSIAATGDKVTRDEEDGGDDYPYHFSGSGSLNYTFPHEVVASLNYTHVQYRREIDSSEGARRTNRIIAEVRKVF